MKNLFEVRALMGASVLCCLFFGYWRQETQAGWSGLINGAGQGWAAVNVTTATNQATGKTLSAKLTTTNMPSPSAAMAPTTGYATNAPLPQGSSTNTVARIKGLPGVIWQARTVGSNGDRADNPELEARVQITAAPCAELDVDTYLTPDSFNQNSGTITVRATGTAGTALWLRGYEYLGNPSDIPVDDPETVENESIEYLKNNGGVLKFENLMVGPFEFGQNGKCELLVPFTLDSGDTNNLYFASDAVAKSVPMVIHCPPDMVVSCDEEVQFPEGLSVDGGCGEIVATYDVPSGGLVLGENWVTATAQDGKGDTASCTFKITVVDSKAPILGSPGPDSVVECPEEPVFTPPSVGDNCDLAPVVMEIEDVVTPGVCGSTYSRTKTWQAVDASGNRSEPVSQTITVRDTKVPTLVNVPGPVTLECGQLLPPVGKPSATDGCDPAPAVTYSEVSTRGSNPGHVSYYNYTVTRTWTARDACNNTTSQSQIITIRDTVPPLVPCLNKVNVDCGSSVTLKAPTTMDKCSGVVVGTTTDPLTYNKAGTYKVRWTFRDVAGNAVTADQTVVVEGIKFMGFYSPISGTGGGCGAPGQPAPLRTISQGSKIPIKFDMQCCSTTLKSGTPPVIKIQEWSSTCTMVSQPVAVNAVYQNDWHYNWDTKGWAKTVYKIVVELPDGTSQFVFIKLK